ncbi:MAG: hypothetical protein M1453_10680 [Acidobacteria bacterium]|nr:hypothetical protein [Acidobacteriota bacterium]MCL5288444.1 hypothetical protein [Acidobacteriota bacterium]
MATRSRSTFAKRQKEMKRMEKQRMKAERRAERNLAKRAGTDADAPGETLNEFETVPTESEPQS